MTQQPSFYAFAGGLDLASPALTVPRGRCIACLNHESVSKGYARIDGFERFDGRLGPTDAYLQAADASTAAAEQEAARAAIEKVPGTGPVRGVAVFNGDVYAWRDNHDGTVGVMHRATPAGWEAVWAMFPAGGRYRTVVHNFYGAANQKRLYGVNGVGKAFEFGSGVGGDVLTFIAVTGLTEAQDKPTRLAAHKQHLFLSFPGGSVQHSGTGEPTTFTAVLGAGEIAMGADVTDFLPSVDALHIFTEDSIKSLLGSDAQDWVLQPVSVEEGSGAVADTAQSFGSPLYLDAGGLRSISATQAYGNFKIGSLIDQISPLIDRQRDLGVRPTASVVVKAKGHYRLFFADGSGISVFFGRKYAEPMVFELGLPVRCITTYNDPDTRARIFFGSDDGFVYEMDRGSSFDGVPIQGFIRLPWDAEGAPFRLKRWHKALLHLEAAPGTTLGMTAEFDYADEEQGTLPGRDFHVMGGEGGVWDLATWDEFYWSTPAEGKAVCDLDGQGVNMSLLIYSTSGDVSAYVLQGVTKMISLRGNIRG